MGNLTAFSAKHETRERNVEKSAGGTQSVRPREVVQAGSILVLWSTAINNYGKYNEKSWKREQTKKSYVAGYGYKNV